MVAVLDVIRRPEAFGCGIVTGTHKDTNVAIGDGSAGFGMPSGDPYPSLSLGETDCVERPAGPTPTPEGRRPQAEIGSCEAP